MRTKATIMGIVLAALLGSMAVLVLLMVTLGPGPGRDLGRERATMIRR